MIAKVLRKLGLGHVAYKLAAPLCSRKYGEIASGEDEVQAAVKLLNDTSPSPGSSCCIPQRKPVEIEQAADLDIIIPAYNVEKYIDRCLESVLSQKSRYSFRVLAVDDGSTDSTGELLEKYKGICLIHQKNRGLSGARNTGLEHANAKYVLFLDSDDELYPGAVENLMSAAEENCAAIVEGAHAEVDDSGKVHRFHRHCQGIMPAIDFEGYAWGKLLRRELFDRAVFPEGYWYQDSLMRQVILPMADRGEHPCVGISQPVVKYRQNPEGITKKSRAKGKSLQSLYITMQLFEDRKRFGLEITDDYYDYILSMAVQTYSRTRRQEDNVKRAIFTVYADFVERNFPGWQTRDKKLACLEKAIREHNYGSYLAYCELH